jgi:2-aminobenzoate-CoA ligase
MTEPSAHTDPFARDHLPPRDLWPDLLLDGDFAYPPRLNCAVELLDKTIESGHGVRVLFHTTDGPQTYRAFAAEVNQIAHALVDTGLVPGNRVLLRGPNTPRLAACWFAVARAGGICVTTMPLLRAYELGYTVEKARVSHALCDARFRNELEKTRAQTSELRSVTYFYTDDADGLEARMVMMPETFDAVDTAADDVALIAFTSGTTGQAKATMHFHRDVLAICDAFPKSCLDVSAGEPLPAPTFHAWHEATGLKIVDGIGSTEMLHIFISVPEAEIKPGTTGKPIPGYEARVVDREGNDVAPGTVGLLAVRGPTGCRYLDDERRQRAYVRDGWNYPGDAYIMDADGYFHYQARTDDMIVSSGYNISGLQVESALLKHDAVSECGVVGVPDEARGQIVKAFVVLRPGFEAGDELAKALQDFVKAEIAPYKYPRAVAFVDALPRTQTGKLQRFRLRDETG